MMSPRRRDRWPLLIVVAGWAVLVAAALAYGGGPGIVDPVVWSFGSLTAAGTALRLWWSPSREARVWTVATGSVVGAARSVAYIAVGAWSPLGVWLIVIGLLILAFRSATA